MEIKQGHVAYIQFAYKDTQRHTSILRIYTYTHTQYTKHTHTHTLTQHTFTHIVTNAATHKYTHVFKALSLYVFLAVFIDVLFLLQGLFLFSQTHSFKLSENGNDL